MIVGLAAACGSEEGGEDYPRRSCEAAFRYQADEAVNEVAVIGDFNQWSPNGFELNGPDGEGCYERAFIIAPGRYAYRFLVDGEERLDPQNPLTLFGRDGREHSALLQEDCGLPAWRVDRAQGSGRRYRAELTFLSAWEGPALSAESVRALLDGREVETDVDVERGKVLIELQAEEGKHRLTIGGEDRDGLAAGDVALPFWIEEPSFSWKDAVIYQVVVDRFRRGGGCLDVERPLTHRMGGDYAGVVEAIQEGYFEKLGVNALWISPAYTNAEGEWRGFDGRLYESYHGYWPTAAREVDPRWGGEEALEALAAAAHGDGLRVILDVVPNHVHEHHPYFEEHRNEWFNHPGGDCICGRECSWGEDIEHCWFTDYLPDLNWRVGDVIDALCADSAWWLGRFDLDGLRVDAVAMMPRLATRYLRRAAESAAGLGGVQVYLIGETYTGPNGRGQILQSLGPQGLSAQFDFPLMWSLRSVIANGEGRMSDIPAEIDESAESWAGSGAVMGLILGNHDLPRFLSAAAGDPLDDALNPPGRPGEEAPYLRQFLAFAVIMTQPGAPVIYYGDEFGMPGANDPDNRRPMRFEGEWNENERALWRKVARLGRIRRAVRACRRGERLDLLKHDDRIAYLMRDEESVMLVALSRSADAALIDLAVPPEFESRDLEDCFGADYDLEAGRLSAVLPPYGALLITDRRTCEAAM